MGKTCLHFAPESCLQPLFKTLSWSYLPSEYQGPGVGDIQSIDFPADSLDYVICHHVLEHVPDDRKALADVHRVLKPGGVFYLAVPLDWTAKTTEYGAPNPLEVDHMRRYGADFPDKFDGFTWDRINFETKFSRTQCDAWGLDPNEPLFRLTALK
jgi:SAM-dependent methyltransferase